MISIVIALPLSYDSKRWLEAQGHSKFPDFDVSATCGTGVCIRRIRDGSEEALTLQRHPLLCATTVVDVTRSPSDDRELCGTGDRAIAAGLRDT
jgi:hypothetical protein